MPHIAALLSQAYARLTAMKLYAYRALDYLQSASANDRRYLLFNAIQKAKVSTEGVKVMDLLSECIGAKGFESETYFEMALRDIQLIPGLEGSTHVNLSLAAQFIPKYFNQPHENLSQPKSLAAGQSISDENPYLMEARSGNVQTIAFGKYPSAYRPLWSIPNVRMFARQARAFRRFIRKRADTAANDDTQMTLAIAHCFAIIVYGQLVAENCLLFDVPREMISAIFQMLIIDLTVCALNLSSIPQLDAQSKNRIGRLVQSAKSAESDWDFVLQRIVAD
jgi:acyl-CoA dehydrogenase